jgi:hypothetical protein
MRRTTKCARIIAIRLAGDCPNLRSQLAWLCGPTPTNPTPLSASTPPPTAPNPSDLVITRIPVQTIPTATASRLGPIPETVVCSALHTTSAQPTSRMSPIRTIRAAIPSRPSNPNQRRGIKQPQHLFVQRTIGAAPSARHFQCLGRQAHGAGGDPGRGPRSKRRKRVQPVQTFASTAGITA